MPSAILDLEKCIKWYMITKNDYEKQNKNKIVFYRVFYNN